MVLAHGDRMLSRLGLAYAINMHQAQGMTTDQGIGVMHSAERHLSNQRLTHVMATRVRDDLTIYTNDRDALLRSIEANPETRPVRLSMQGHRRVHLNRRRLKACANRLHPVQRPIGLTNSRLMLRRCGGARQARGRSEACVDPCP
jgi:hypothetical protein